MTDIAGTKASKTLTGTPSGDRITGDDGNDVAFLGAGNDLFRWSAGDGNDTVEGGAGTDRLLVDGSRADEAFGISAVGRRVLLSRDVDDVAIDLDGVEQLEVRTRGGADSVAVGDLSGTDVTTVALRIAASANGQSADIKIDSVTVDGSAAADAIALSSAGTRIVVTGLPAEVGIDLASRSDVLAIDGGPGADLIEAAMLPAGMVALRVSGGEGADTIIGSAGDDRVTGGRGDDIVEAGVFSPLGRP